MTPAEARAAIDRRVAVAVLAGATVGSLPLIWLIREALDTHASATLLHAMRFRRDPEPPEEVPLLRAEGHELCLVGGSGANILVEHDDIGSTVRSHEAPNAALVLHNAVRGDPVRAEALLAAIEVATEAWRK